MPGPKGGYMTLIDVPQLIHQEEINLLTEIDRLGKSCKKRYQTFK